MLKLQRHKEPQEPLFPVYTGTKKYRDDYGKFIPIIQKADLRNLRKNNMKLKVCGETTLKHAGKYDRQIILNNFRYKVKKPQILQKCVGYIVIQDEQVIKLGRKRDMHKLIVQTAMACVIVFAQFSFLNSDGTWDMMWNRAIQSEKYRDNFNYNDQVVNQEDTIKIQNNTYNPGTLQYTIYDGDTKIFDTGTMKPGDELEMKYSVYFNEGQHNLKCETVVKSLDGQQIIDNKTHSFTLNIR